jgi:hypothetical protein
MITAILGSSRDIGSIDNATPTGVLANDDPRTQALGRT